MTDHPDLWVKARHYPGCTGDLCRTRAQVTVDRLGRIGNGGIVAHEYVCNRSWGGCRAKVLISERAVRALVVAAVPPMEGATDE